MRPAYPLFRREWSSVYEALQDCRPDAGKIDATIHLYRCHKWNAQYWPDDHTAWLRPHAPTLTERTYEHQPTASPRGIPVGIAQGHSTIAPIPHGDGPLRTFVKTRTSYQLGKPDRSRRSTMSSECVSISCIDLSPYLIVSLGVPLC